MPIIVKEQSETLEGVGRNVAEAFSGYILTRE